MKLNVKRIKCFLTGGCKFKSLDTESKCNDKEKTCTITGTCCKCGKKYENIPITILQTDETVVASIEVCVEDGREVAYFETNVLGRLDYQETFMVLIKGEEIPFIIRHLSSFTGTFPVRMEMYAKQVGTFTIGKWEEMLNRKVERT